MKHRSYAFLIAIMLILMSITPLATAAAERQPATKLFIDTDIGVDDAVAIAWLLGNRNANILGFSTVAGNTTVTNATQNLLTLLDAANRSDIPIAIGAAAPLSFRLSHTGAFVHGPSGMWFSQIQHNLNAIPHDAPAAIAAAARANPGMTLVALGPLTNVAQAIQRFPTDLVSTKIIALAGARYGGNSTPVAEANAYVDPHALKVVLDSNVNLTLVTLDMFDQVQVDSAKFPARLAAKGGPVGQLLAGALQVYFAASTQGQGGDASIPDVAAAMYAVQPKLATATSALVFAVTDAGLTRGQTIMATDPGVKVTMIAGDDELSALVDRYFSEPGFDLNSALAQILMRSPDNAKILTAIKGETMARILERDLTK